LVAAGTSITISDYGKAPDQVPFLFTIILDSAIRLIMSDLDKIYYHGTETRRAYATMTQGFKLGEEVHGRLLGRGLYIAQQLNSAKFWSHFIVIKCQLLPGTRILWLHEGYDKKVLAYLKKEFGKELLTLGPQFHRAIPKNKQLTGRELVTLCNYIFETRREKKWQYLFKARKGKKAQYYGDAWHDLARLHDQVKRHGYRTVGKQAREVRKSQMVDDIADGCYQKSQGQGEEDRRYPHPECYWILFPYPVRKHRL